MAMLRPAFRTVGGNFVFDPNGIYTFQSINVGKDVYIGSSPCIEAAETTIDIGNKVLIGPSVIIRGGDHNYSVIGRCMYDVKEKKKGDDLPVVIEDDVWIGSRVTILKGVRVGRGSIIGAGSVVTKSVSPYSIVAGVPAKVIGQRFTNAEISTHETILYDSSGKLKNI